MKKNILFFAVLLVLFNCKSSDNNKNTISFSDIATQEYKGYGQTMNSQEIFTKNGIEEKFESIKSGDTIDVAFTSTVNAVCKKKGCWMKVAMSNDKETMVRFKDYGFFVPIDIETDTVIVQGKAFVNEMSVDDQRHYAKDAGKSEEEIAAITKPKKTYSFIADGVLVKN